MEDAKAHPVLSLVTTVGSLDDAQRLARLVLEQRLGACVQIEPQLLSHYVWQGRHCEEPETRLTIKTLPGREAGLQALFAAHHPYGLPQFLATVMEASPAYAQWVAEAVSDPAGS
jgi:periplasmic divalent cation tolerance protein